MHEQSIIDSIVQGIHTDGCAVKTISLYCDENTLRERLQKDIDQKLRLPDVVSRSVARIPLYSRLNTVKIDTTEKSVAEVCQLILNAKAQ